MTLVLTSRERARIAALVRASYPHEACGVLVGRREGAGEAERVLVLELEPARNTVVEADPERAHERYELDPSDFLRCDAKARAAGLEIVGIWHSHPDRSPRPSQADRVGAWEGWSYVIASVGAEGLRELRSWKLSDGAFREEPLETPAVAAEAPDGREEQER